MRTPVPKLSGVSQGGEERREREGEGGGSITVSTEIYRRLLASYSRALSGAGQDGQDRSEQNSQEMMRHPQLRKELDHERE